MRGSPPYLAWLMPWVLEAGPVPLPLGGTRSLPNQATLGEEPELPGQRVAGVTPASPSPSVGPL